MKTDEYYIEMSLGELDAEIWHLLAKTGFAENNWKKLCKSNDKTSFVKE